MKSTRTKALAIGQSVKKEVHSRDKGCCIFCGQAVEEFYACCHVIPRSSGGLGIAENIVTGCYACHSKMDSTENRKWMVDYAVEYLRKRYANFDKTQLIYTKGWVKP